MSQRALSAAEFSKALTVTVPATIAARGREVVFDAVTQLHEELTLNTPVDTGYLRAGLSASTEGVTPPAAPARKDVPRDPKTGKAAAMAYGPEIAAAGAQVAGAIGAAAARFRRILLGYVAEYAPYVEDRRHMVKTAAGKWRQIVERAVRNAGGDR